MASNPLFKPRTLFHVPALLLALVSAAPATAQPPSATTLTLTSDVATAPVNAVVHLTATLQSASSATGSITFLDNAQPLLTLHLDSHNLAVLAIASLPQGTHTLTATYSGDAANSSSTSAHIDVAITALPSSLTLASSATTTYAGTPITLTAASLPTPATGSISFTDGTSTLATTAVPGLSTPLYQALGDSITYGVGLADPSTHYPNLFAANYGFTLANYGYSGSVACDILPFQILTNGVGPTQSTAPLSSLLIGTNDVDYHPPQPYLPIFTTCHEAALTWLAIPREYKVLPGDPAATVLSGTWTSNPGTFDLTTYATLFNSSSSGTARFSVTSAGAPLYLWYLMGDNLSGSFALTLDGIPTGTVYSTHPATPIASIIAVNSSSIGYALLRLPVSAGPHTLDISVQSGTVGILGAATAPSPGLSSVHPTVLVGDVPNQLPPNPQASPSVIAQYTQSIQQEIALLHSDGLDLRSVPTQQFLLGTSAEMSDTVHPNALGDVHLATAFESVFANSPLAPYTTFVNAPPFTTATFAAPGPHILNATYSGDNVYAASAAPPIRVNVLPQITSTTTLSTSATRYPARTSIAFNTAVTPSTATGTVTFYDGTVFLAQLPLNSGTATFTSATLAPGLHNLTASYSGDGPDTPSASPTLTIQIDLAPTALTLAPIPSTLPYGATLSLSATVTPSAATGPITFLDAFTPASQSSPQRLTLGQSTLTNGNAILSPSNLLPGTHILTATYPGDPFDLPATSPALTIQILAATTTTTLIASPTSIAYGASETLTATIFPASASGTVTFRDSVSGTLTPVTLLSGSASFTTSTLTLGAHTLTATYSGDTLHAPSTSASIVLQVNPATSRTVITPLAPTISLGSPFNLTATVSPASATGTVLFRDASTGTLGQTTFTNGTATFTLSSLPAGTYNITATYSGDTFDTPSTSAAVSTHITLAPTVLTLAPLPASVPYATPLALTATVSLISATGQITFADTNATPIGTAILTNGTAVLKLSTLTVGPHTLHAAYSGDPNNAPSTAAATLTVVPDPTSTILTLALANVPVGNPIAFNVRVTTAPNPTAGGTITIRSGATTLASGPLVNSAAGLGYATLSVSSTTLGPGTFPMTAFYSGDPNDAPSNTSATSLNVTILPIPTSVALTLSATQIPAGAPITLSAAVTSAAQLPPGTVSFYQNAKLIATVPLTASATASTVLSGLAIGGYHITATYNPTGLFATSSTPEQDLTVSPPISIALTPSALSGGPASTHASTLIVTPLFGFSSSIQAQCQPSVTWITCTIDPVPSITSTAPVSSAVHIAIAANTLAASTTPTSTVFLAVLLPLLALGKRRHLPRLCVLLLTSALAATLIGCAEGGTFGNTPPGTHTVQINVIAGGATFATTLTVNVTQ